MWCIAEVTGVGALSALMKAAFLVMRLCASGVCDVWASDREATRVMDEVRWAAVCRHWCDRAHVDQSGVFLVVFDRWVRGAESFVAGSPVASLSGWWCGWWCGWWRVGAGVLLSLWCLAPFGCAGALLLGWAISAEGWQRWPSNIGFVVMRCAGGGLGGGLGGGRSHEASDGSLRRLGGECEKTLRRVPGVGWPH